MIEIFSLESSFHSEFKLVDYEVDKIMYNFRKAGFSFDRKTNLYLQFAIRELFNNAVEHGNKGDYNKLVYYKTTLCNDNFIIQVTDCGYGFDLNEKISREVNKVILEDRNRGLASMNRMGFLLKNLQSSVCAQYHINVKYVTNERMASMIDIKLDNEIAYCIVKNNLLSANVNVMAEEIRNQLIDEKSYKGVVMDLSDSEIIDSMGITFLVNIYKDLTSKGKSLLFRGTSDELLDLFQVMRLDEVFEFEK